MFKLLSQKGVSLVESLLAIVIVGVIVFLLAGLPNAISLITKSKNLSIAREIATKQIEDKRITTYANLANGSSNISDPRIKMLPSGGGTVVIMDCDIQVCSNNEHIKQVTVMVNWEESGKDTQISIETFVAEGGLN